MIAAACSDGTGGTTQPKADSGSAPDAKVPNIPDDANQTPCDVRAVLQAVCQQCHSLPPKNGAPFPLVRHGDIIRVGSDGRTIREDMIAQLEARRMPLEPATIDDASRATLLAWLRAGAPKVAPTSCMDGGVPSDASGEDAADARDSDTEDADAEVDASDDAAM